MGKKLRGGDHGIPVASDLVSEDAGPSPSPISESPALHSGVRPEGPQAGGGASTQGRAGVHPKRLTSSSSSMPVPSCTSCPSFSISPITSDARASPRFTMKFPCLGETSASLAEARCARTHLLDQVDAVRGQRPRARFGRPLRSDDGAEQRRGGRGLRPHPRPRLRTGAAPPGPGRCGGRGTGAPPPRIGANWRACSRSMQKILPGCRRSLRTMSLGGISRQPTSDAMTTRSSFVTT